MSEKIYACLLRLYPARFRRVHGKEALQLFRDRYRDETGFFRRLRLWLDILVDLAMSLPGQYAGMERALVMGTGAQIVGAPFFFILEEESLRPGALFSSFVFTLAALSFATVLLNEAGTYRALQTGSTQSEFSSRNGWLTPNTSHSPSSARQPMQASVDAAGSLIASDEFFPPPIDYLALTNVRAHRREVVFVYATGDVSMPSRSHPSQTGDTPSAAVAPCAGSSPLDPERQRVIDTIISNLKHSYFDSAVAQQMAEVLATRQRCGDYEPATDDKTFAHLLTAQLRDVSHDMHLEILYSPAASEPSAEEFSRRLAALQKDNCSFKKVQIFPHNIGYVRLDAFLEPSVCGSTAVAAMTSLNNTDALIFDLRNNHGGTAEMVSLISSYLFDHPEYMFDPRRVPTPQSWTSSPVPGSKLASKPVFILTSPATISAAEQFTYDLKMLKRATIVGETTAGAAHAGVWHRIDDQFAMAIPENRAVNPYFQSDWEATGIRPDIAVPASAALQTALRKAWSQLQNQNSR
jgi:hypothetical protein